MRKYFASLFIVSWAQAWGFVGFAAPLPPVVQASVAKDVPLTENLHLYFKEGDNQRERLFKATLPPDSAAYGRIVLKFKLHCPSGGCDYWDRVGSFGIQDNKGRFFELLRFVTPYGIGGSWEADLSAFRPLLLGEKIFRVAIDTWVGPGSPYGGGWLVDASIQFVPGSDPHKSILVLPLLSVEDIPYGNPELDTKRSASLPPLIGAGSAQLVSTITGHGQGNAENCAEFCPKNHEIRIGKQSFSKIIWRDDCATTVDPLQKGNYSYPRAGWCPGDKVEPWIIDISAALLSGPAEFTYQPEAFENSCRPKSLVCEACVFGTSCEFDGGLHTEARYLVSTFVVYRQ